MVFLLRRNFPALVITLKTCSTNESYFSTFMKRVVDFILSACGLIVLFPVFMVVAVMIRLTSPGPAFFRQLRVGRCGRSFIMLKFRTMTMLKDAENGKFEAGSSARVTRIGRV